MTISGGCLCKSVRISVTGAPLAARTCWCRVCQYLGAGNGAVSVCFRTDAVSVAGDVKWFESIADSGNRMSRRILPDLWNAIIQQGPIPAAPDLHPRRRPR